MSFSPLRNSSARRSPNVSATRSQLPGRRDCGWAARRWDRVQAQLAARPQPHGRTAGGKASRPCIGLVFDETGDRLTPVHATKNKRRYDHCVSTRPTEADAVDPSRWRLSAPVLERAVFDGILTLLQDHGKLQMLMHEQTARDSAWFEDPKSGAVASINDNASRAAFPPVRSGGNCRSPSSRPASSRGSSLAISLSSSPPRS